MAQGRRNITLVLNQIWMQIHEYLEGFVNTTDEAAPHILANHSTSSPQTLKTFTRNVGKGPSKKRYSSDADLNPDVYLGFLSRDLLTVRVKELSHF